MWVTINPGGSHVVQFLCVSPSVSFENLDIYLITREVQEFGDKQFVGLDQALEEGKAFVHETGTVGQLDIENIGDVDLFVQIGDIVKGGRQDRTMGVDFIVPPKSGRIPIPAFCIESGRWHKRGGESDVKFSSAKSAMACKKSIISAYKVQGPK